MESQFFIYDGIKSSDMDLHIMRIDHSGFIETPYTGSVDIKQEKVAKKHTPYFFGVERDNIEFTVQLVLMDKYNQPRKWSSQERYKIAKWLFHDEYKEFISSDDIGKRYFCIATSDSNLNLINTQGFLEVTFTCNAPYGFSPVYVESFDLTGNTTSTIIEIENKSNILTRYYPKLEIEYPSMTGFADSTNVTLKNLSDGGREFKLTDVKKGETYSFDNENRIIKSSRQVNLNPLTHFNRNWLNLVYGVNQIEVSGKVNIYLKMEYPIIQ